MPVTLAPRPLAAVLVVALAACGGGPDPERERATIAELERRFEQALADRDLEAFSDFWAEDAVYFPLFGPRREGRQQVVDAWATLFEPGAPRLRWEPLRIEVARSGDLAYSHGRYEVLPAQEGPPLSTGTYLTVWRRAADGQWKVAADIGNLDTPPAGSTAPE